MGDSQKKTSFNQVVRCLVCPIEGRVMEMQECRSGIGGVVSLNEGEIRMLHLIAHQTGFGDK